jgi:hypothetical protein
MKLASTLKIITVLGIGILFAACGSSDTESTSQPATGTCGNGTIDGTEACDGTNFGGKTCATVTVGARPNGNLTCNSCVISDATCTATVASGGASGVGTGGAPVRGGSSGIGGSSGANFGGKPGADAGLGR